MPQFSIEDLSQSQEMQIITNIIVDDTICNETISFIKVGYFESRYLRIIFKWIQKWNREYNGAPKGNLRSIFNNEAETITEAERNIVEEILINLDRRYRSSKNLNRDYLKKQTIDFIKSKYYIRLGQEIESAASRGDLDIAQELISSSNGIPSEILLNTPRPFSQRTLVKHFRKEREPMFSLSGRLGELIGGFDRGWFVGFIGPMKRGKSWWLIETAIQSFLHNYKTLFISLEMTEDSVLERCYMRLTSTSRKAQNVLYPIFDCALNQNGQCNLPCRRNRIKLLNENGEKPEYRPSIKYKTCTECRPNYPYQAATWLKGINRPSMNTGYVRKKLQNLSTMFSEDNFRVKVFPRFSASVDDIVRHIETLERKDGWIPSTVIIDYADILKSSDQYLRSERALIDDIYKNLGRMAMERHVLLVTASQSNRGSIRLQNVLQENVAEDIRKMAHLDLGIALNQTSKEKLEKVMRVGVIAHRHHEFHESRQALCLQNYFTGQVSIDSEIITV